MKGKSQQAFFVLDMRPAGGEVQKSFGIFRAGIAREHEDFTVLLDDNDAFGVVGNFFHPERAVEFEVWKSDCELKGWNRIGSASKLKEDKKCESEIEAFGDVHAGGK